MNDRDLVLDGLAAYRLTRLLSTDVILDRPRAAIVRSAYEWRDGSRGSIGRQHPRWWLDRAENDDEAPKLAELVICRWCVGIHCATFVMCARRWCPRAWQPIAEMLTLSSVAALLARLEG